ncbi:hypothetical protein LCGC14_1831230 [marine sediment metagenome]|uniref:Uncharacterized protein n=1 Tax=marine sediment metagenome TaxID=412755 RepID=A0A0F9GGC9_9ZZZZ
MSCEDCKNYEKGEDFPSRANLRVLSDALATVCKNRQCENCNLKEEDLDCPIHMTHTRLQDHGVDW